MTLNRRHFIGALGAAFAVSAAPVGALAKALETVPAGCKVFSVKRIHDLGVLLWDISANQQVALRCALPDVAVGDLLTMPMPAGRFLVRPERPRHNELGVSEVDQKWWDAVQRQAEGGHADRPDGHF
jgi:hypothetical protein